MNQQHILKRRKIDNIQLACFKFLHEADPQSASVEMYHKLRTYIYVYVDGLELRKL